MRFFLILLSLFLLADDPLSAGEADVLTVEVKTSGNGLYQFDVTVQHNDQGWGHYADRFEILGPDDAVLGIRVLHHPHVDEQPFTRSLTGVRIPAGISEVTVRARDSVHDFGGATVTVAIPKE